MSSNDGSEAPWAGTGGGILVGRLEEPYAVLVQAGATTLEFMRERRELLPEGEFRETLAPRFHLGVDSRGRIYAVDQVDYEIRKYGAEGE